MPAETPLQRKIAALGMKIADEASADGVGLDQRLDALKVLTAYQVAMGRLGRDEDDDEPGVISFGNLQQRIAAASGRS